MVNEDILGGLRLALSKGESLEQAMNSFYNANYKKEEIEEAARFVNSPQTQPSQKKTISSTPKRQISSVKKVRPKKQKYPRKAITSRPVRTIQNVSGYGNKQKKPEGTVMTIILIFFLLILVGILTAVFLFKSELIELFNNLIS
ncbi:hypothetical protein KAR52_02700 [Candidatus Pacearchaeota archaeon]|nr:hypothetical protein [Candidatus Pacearchaeota archaeon]